MKNININNIFEKSLLYDFYGPLLTDHQREVYGDYIQNDLSLTELAGLHGISRQGAYDMVKRCERLLSDYEDRLHLVGQFRRVKKMVAQIRTQADEIRTREISTEVGGSIEKIMEITDAILEEY